MTKEDVKDICLICILVLFPAAALGLFVILERFYAALFNVWKFYGYGGDKGIDIGASSFFFTIFFCICAICVCMPIIFYLRKSDRKWLYRSAMVTSVIYLINCLLLLILIVSGLAFITYER